MKQLMLAKNLLFIYIYVNYKCTHIMHLIYVVHLNRTLLNISKGELDKTHFISTKLWLNLQVLK